MARTVTEREGRLDVCSICGDQPAPVYRTEEAPAPGSVATLRLCEDCLEIRKLKGENFIPLTMTLIFQYGSNCSESEINGEARLRGNATFVGIAETVEDCQLAFDIHSRGRECAAADIVVKPGSKVWGVLYKVPDFLIERTTAKQQGRKALDQIEGEGTNYTRRTIDVKCPDGTICTATTYTARKPGCDVPTSLAYVRLIVNGLREHGVSEQYIAEVKTIASANNPDIAADVNAL
jgi:gamma-glutamylcyclotransferase (GGCT)/AIG2-like uncharacterized protein YtfP